MLRARLPDLGSPDELFAQVVSMAALTYTAFSVQGASVGVLFGAAWVTLLDPVVFHAGSAVMAVGFGPAWVAAVLNAGAAVFHYTPRTPTPTAAVVRPPSPTLSFV